MSKDEFAHAAGFRRHVAHLFRYSGTKGEIGKLGVIRLALPGEREPTLCPPKFVRVMSCKNRVDEEPRRQDGATSKLLDPSAMGATTRLRELGHDSAKKASDAMIVTTKKSRALPV